MSSWSELPRDVLAVIAGRLTVATDRVRFSVVCRNWSSVAKSEINYLPCSPPWLMLADKPDGSCLRVFVSADGKEKFELDLPEIRIGQCVGSTGCWVVMDDLSWNLYLLNPLSRAKIDLPPMFAFDDEGEFSVTDTTNWMFPDHFISEKVVLSFLNSDPDFNFDFDFGAMAVFDETRRLAYTRKGAKSWQALEFSECRDIIFFKEKFYALDRSGILFKCLIDCSPPKVVMISEQLEEICCRDRMYLVEFCGAILQVVKIIEGLIFNEYTTVGFRVFMFDFTTRRWMEIYDLGEYSLFLGCNTSVAILSSCSINLKPNCIYFTDEIRRKEGIDYRFLRSNNDIGVYNLHDSTIVRCSLPKFSPHSCAEFWVAKSSPPLWIVPTSLSVTPDHTS